MKKTVKKSIPKAQLGAIIKGIRGAIKGGKAAYTEAKASKFSKPMPKFPEQKTLTKAAAELNFKNKKNIKNIQKNYNKPMPKFPEQKYVTKEQVMKNMAKRKSKNK